jgi:hypothetical protein
MSITPHVTNPLAFKTIEDNSQASCNDGQNCSLSVAPNKSCQSSTAEQQLPDTAQSPSMMLLQNATSGNEQPGIQIQMGNKVVHTWIVRIR